MNKIILTTIIIFALPVFSFASPLQWPDHVATKQDVLNLMKVYPERTKEFLKRVKSEKVWLVEKKLLPGELTTISKDRKVIEDKNETTKEVTRYQMIQEPDLGHLKRLGLTATDAQCLIDTGKECK